MCWDATRHFNQFGRYLNHALCPNAALTSPTHVRGKWRIGFVAIQDINIGDEVVWDYGVRDQEWNTSRLVDGVIVMSRPGRGRVDDSPQQTLHRTPPTRKRTGRMC